MPDSRPDSDSPVTLEALLRLKRHEQPGPEFWESFERETHRRRLQELVQARPSWLHRARTLLFRPAPALALASLSACTLALFFSSSFSPLAGPSSSSPAETGDPLLAASPPPPEANLTPVALPPAPAPVTAQPTLLAASKTDFGVDVVVTQPPAYRFRAYRTDMQPASFKVSDERLAVYAADTLGRGGSWNPLAVAAPVF